MDGLAITGMASASVLRPASTNITRGGWLRWFRWCVGGPPTVPPTAPPTAPADRGRLLGLGCSRCRLSLGPAEQLGVVVGGLGLRAHRRVDHPDVFADQDPPGSG